MYKDGSSTHTNGQVDFRMQPTSAQMMVIHHTSIPLYNAMPASEYTLIYPVYCIVDSVY